jgi:hypothetical protein
MAMELRVFSDRRLNSIAEWQHAIDAEGFPLRLAGDIHLSAISGLLPAKLDNRQTGFECYQDDAKEAMNFLGVRNFDHSWKFALGLRWGGDFSQLEAAWMAATAYAAATDGIIFDCEEGRVFTTQQARELVIKFVSERPRMKAIIEDIVRQVTKTRPA